VIRQSPIVGMRETHFAMVMRTTKITMIATIMLRMMNQSQKIGQSFMTSMEMCCQHHASQLYIAVMTRTKWIFLRKQISLGLLLIAIRKTIFLTQKSANLIIRLVKLFSKVKCKIHH
jgi:hypothetical protein